MDRREAISMVAMIMGGVVIGAEAFLSGCSFEPEYQGLLTENGYEELLDEIADVILPDTPASPGAKAAKVGRFMNVFVTECYDPKDQQIFLAGIPQLESVATSVFGKKFTSLTAEQKYELLLILEDESKDRKKTQPGQKPEVHYYILIKQLTLLGYLTSEIGATKAMRHVAIPGKFEPCIPYKPGDKAFSG